MGVDFGRNFASQRVVELLSEGGEYPPEGFSQPAGDPGFFGPRSPVWRVHGDTSMFIGGLRALLLQTMHPLAMAGVAQHSQFKHDPIQRLQRTAAFIRDTTFGDSWRAEQAIQRVLRAHAHVRGVASDGRRYSALDPALVRWVHAAETDSFLVAHDHYGREPLSPSERDGYLKEAATIAIRLGADWVPTNARELEEYFVNIRPELEAGPDARETAHWILFQPAKAWIALPQTVLAAGALALLPPWVRRELGLSPKLLGVDILDTVSPAIIRPASHAAVRTLGWVLPSDAAHDAARRRAAKHGLL